MQKGLAIETSFPQSYTGLPTTQYLDNYGVLTHGAYNTKRFFLTITSDVREEQPDPARTKRSLTVNLSNECEDTKFKCEHRINTRF